MWMEITWWMKKGKTATLTPSGVKKAEAFFHVDNVSDADNMTLMHHINQAIPRSRSDAAKM